MHSDARMPWAWCRRRRPLRGSGLVLALVLSAVLPMPAYAIAPTNDTIPGAIVLNAAYAPATAPVTIPPDPTIGGWVGATTDEDATSGLSPTCLGSSGYHSMWYAVHVSEASVLTAQLRSGDPNLYKPVVSIISQADKSEVACALAGNALQPDIDVTASGYVTAGDYWIRIGSATNPDTDVSGLPIVQLTEFLRDVTPPQIHVTSSKTVGVGKPFTFNATASTDAGSTIDPASATWTFRDHDADHHFNFVNSATPEIATYTWKTPGFHLVTVTLADRGNNTATYSFNVFVHSFVAPKVAIRVVPPKPGARQLRVLLTHDQPVRVRLVVLQAGSVLRTLPSKGVTGSRVTSITIPLQHKVAKTDYVFVSGTASDLSAYPNTVALKTCSVRPGKPGQTCA